LQATRARGSIEEAADMLYDDRPLCRRIEPGRDVGEGTLFFGLTAGMCLIGLLAAVIALGYGEVFYLREGLPAEAANHLSP
jgi:hypothetical protein